MKQFFCELLFICAAAAPGAQPIDDLAYGTVLYEYYQQDFDAALLQTLISQQRGYMGEDPIRFQLAEGSFAFAGNMYGYANEVFSQVSDEEMTELDRMRLAFHLAREYHRRQDWEALAPELEKIQLGKSFWGRQYVHPEVEYMRGELAVQQAQWEVAEQAFAAMEETNPLRAYGLFNLGVAYRANNRLDAARSTFRSLSELPAHSDEAYDLSQRARLALAMIARQAQDAPEAETVLADLPGSGRYQDVAMAAYGGLAMDNANYELAARIWMTLKEQEYWTASTATARLGFPLSLDRMAEQGRRGSQQLALMHYQQAEESFSARHAVLTDLTQQAQDPGWVRDLLNVFAMPSEDAEQQAMMQRWQDQLGHTDWLEWLATDDVHQALSQWRELNEMDSWLADMPNQVGALEEVSNEQQRRGELAKRLLEGEGFLAARAALTQQIEALSGDIAELRQSKPQKSYAWLYPLADQDERELLDELAAMEAKLVHMTPKDQAKWSARLQRLLGVVFYQVAAEQNKRVRLLEKKHNELRTLLAESAEKIARVQAAEDNFVAGVGTDFVQFVDRADDLIARVKLARETREEMLASEIRTRMLEERERVEAYLLVTRIAIARVTDQLALAGDAQ